jgi:WD40 repeat protein
MAPFRPPTVSVFRDETSLAITPDLRGRLEEALAASRFLIVLASPLSAASEWVQWEVEWWLTHRSTDSLLIVLTDGSLVWNGPAGQNGDFDWRTTNALPRLLEGKVKRVPFWHDLTWVRSEAALNSDDPRFQTVIVDLISTLLDRNKEELIGEHVSARRQTLKLAVGLVCFFAVLAIALLGASIYAVGQRNEAETQRIEAETQRNEAQTQRDEAQTQRTIAVDAQAQAVTERDRATEQAQIATSRQVAAEALANAGDALDLGLLLSLESWTKRQTLDGRSALLTLLQSNPYLAAFLHGHRPQTFVESLVFSEDGTRLVSGDHSGTIVVWDVGARRPIGRYSIPRGPASSLAFSPEHALLAAGTNGGTFLFDLTHPPDDAGLLAEPTLVDPRRFSHVAFTRDGGTLGMATALDPDRPGGILLWNIRERRLMTVNADTGLATAVAFHPDAQTMVVGNDIGVVSLWNLSTCTPGPRQSLTCERRGEPLKAHETDFITRIQDIAFSRDGSRMITASIGQVVHWTFEEAGPRGVTVPPFLLPGGSRTALSPDGNLIITGGSGVTLYDTADNGYQETKEAHRYALPGSTGRVVSVAFSPDNRVFASGGDGGRVVLWDLGVRYPASRLLDGAHASDSLAFSPSGGHVVAINELPDVAMLWDLSEPQAPGKQLPVPAGKAASAAFSSDPGTPVLAVAACIPARVGPCAETEVTLWNTATMQQQGAALPRAAGAVGGLSFSPDGTLIAGVSPETGVAFIWDVRQSQQAPERLPEQLGRITSVAFQPGARDLTLVLGGTDGTLIDWDPRARAERRRFRHHAMTVAALRFDASGDVMATMSCRPNAFRDPAGPCPEGEITIWDSTKGVPVGVTRTGIDANRGPVDIALNPDGRVLAVSSGVGTVLWSVDPVYGIGQQLGLPLGPHEWSSRALATTGVAFSPDGQQLATGRPFLPGRTPTGVVLWDVGVERLGARACSVANRNLSPDEWARFLPDETRILPDDSPRLTCPGAGGPPAPLPGPPDRDVLD